MPITSGNCSYVNVNEAISFIWKEMSSVKGVFTQNTIFFVVRQKFCVVWPNLCRATQIEASQFRSYKLLLCPITKFCVVRPQILVSFKHTLNSDIHIYTCCRDSVGQRWQKCSENSPNIQIYNIQMYKGKSYLAINLLRMICF
jgi:hypothetical protein